MNESLEQDRDHLLRSLDDLEREREAGDLAEADYLALRDDYTARAAEVLRALGRADADAGTAAGGHGTAPGGDAGGTAPGGDAGGTAPGGIEGNAPGGVEGTTAVTADPPADEGNAAETADPPAVEAGRPPAAGRRSVVLGPPARRRSSLRPVLAGVVLLAFAAGAGALVARSAGERLPGDAASGSIAETGPTAGIVDDLARARDLIGKGETLAAIKVYDTVIERDPQQPEALAYRGWLLRLAGRAAGNTALVDKGMEFIERAVAADPTYPDAHFFRAFVLYQDRGDPAAAIPELRTFLASSPPAGMVAVVEDLLSRALAESQGAPAAPAAPAGPAPTTAPVPPAPE